MENIELNICNKKLYKCDFDLIFLVLDDPRLDGIAIESFLISIEQNIQMGSCKLLRFEPSIASKKYKSLAVAADYICFLCHVHLF